MGRNRPLMSRKISIIRMRNGLPLTDPINSVINSYKFMLSLHQMRKEGEDMGKNGVGKQP